MTGDFFLTQWFFLGMRWLCENVVNNSVFLTILISTILLRLLTLFSDIKQRKTAAKTAALQPELEKLKLRYQNDPQKFQQEQMKLMKENGVGMFGGCLPLILTMVLLFCFIAAFRFWGFEQNVKTVLEMSENISVTMRAEGVVDKDATNADCIKKLQELTRIANAKDNNDVENSDSADASGALSKSDKDSDADKSDAEGSDLIKSDAAISDEAVTILENDTENSDSVEQVEGSIESGMTAEEAQEILNNIYSNTEISETFQKSKFLWINNIWQPDNGFSKVVIPENTFFNVNYKTIKKLIYLEDNPEKRAELIELGIFYDEVDGYSKLSDDEKMELLTTAGERYNILMQPIEDLHEGHNNGWFILPVLATLFQLFYALYSQKNNPANATGQSQGKSMKIMTYFMPVLTFWFCLSYTSAFAMYWTLSSMTMLIVNIVLTKVMKPETVGKKSNTK